MGYSQAPSFSRVSLILLMSFGPKLKGIILLPFFGILYKQEMNKALNNKTSNQKKIIKFAALKEDVDLHKMMVSGIKQAVWKKYNY